MPIKTIIITRKFLQSVPNKVKINPYPPQAQIMLPCFCAVLRRGYRMEVKRVFMSGLVGGAF